MASPPILLKSHFGEGTLAPFGPYLASGALRAVWEWDLTDSDFAQAPAIILTMHLDQIRAMHWRASFDTLLARGGRVVLSGHVMRPFIEGLDAYVPAPKDGKAGLALSVLADHPIFAGVDRLACGVRRGVAGFYGRGHNPMPEGAMALTGVGTAQAPIDWIWRRPDGGEVFSHAGNDLWSVAEPGRVTDRLVANMVLWARAEPA